MVDLLGNQLWGMRIPIGAIAHLDESQQHRLHTETRLVDATGCDGHPQVVQSTIHMSRGAPSLNDLRIAG